MHCEAFTEKGKKCTRKISDGKFCWQHNDLKQKCSEYLKEKIRTNITEFNENKNFSSKKQAIAVAYEQTRKIYPDCDKVFSPRSSPRSSPRTSPQKSPQKTSQWKSSQKSSSGKSQKISPVPRPGVRHNDPVFVFNMSSSQRKRYKENQKEREKLELKEWNRQNRL
jgi:hypothetical protein